MSRAMSNDILPLKFGYSPDWIFFLINDKAYIILP